MGIRFYCPNGHKLNVKEFQAGRRGICPFCGSRTQIPTQSTRPASKSRVQHGSGQAATQPADQDDDDGGQASDSSPDILPGEPPVLPGDPVGGKILGPSTAPDSPPAGPVVAPPAMPRGSGPSSPVPSSAAVRPQPTVVQQSVPLPAMPAASAGPPALPLGPTPVLPQARGELPSRPPASVPTASVPTANGPASSPASPTYPTPPRPATQSTGGYLVHRVAPGAPAPVVSPVQTARVPGYASPAGRVEVSAPPPLPAQSAPAEPPDPIAEAPEMIWYVRPPSGGQFGPAAGDLMRSWLTEGRVSADSLVWREGWRDWQEAGTVFPKLRANQFIDLLESAPVVPITSVPLSHAHAHRPKHRSSDRSQLVLLGFLSLAVVVLICVFLWVLLYR